LLIVTAKLSRRRLALWGAAVVVLLCCALLLGSGRGQPALGVETAVSTKGIKTNEDRLRFLSDFGWQVFPEPVAVEELLIPKQFDDSYNDYLALQAEQGFDLTRLAGKRLKRYTYQIFNYPTGQQDVQVNLLIYKNTVVGGEVLSSKLDGLLHGLAMPTQ